MAEDAYKLKKLEEIMDFDSEIMYENKPVYNTENGIIYRKGKIFTADYSEDETEILIRDVEGIIIDKLSSAGNGKKSVSEIRTDTYKNWEYTEGN